MPIDGRQLWPPEVTAGIEEEKVGGIATAVYVDRPRHLFDTLRASAIRAPQRSAVADSRETLSYDALLDQVRRVAWGLQTELNLKPGERVGLVLQNGVDFCIAFYAIAALGAVVVPMSSKLKSEELRYMLRDAGCRAVILNPEWWPRVEPIQATIPAERFYFAETGASHDGLVEAGVGAGIGEKGQRLGWFSTLRTAEPPGTFLADGPHHRGSEHDTACLMYTSGTTGQPKGAVITHFNFMHTAITYERCHQLREGDRTLIAVPLFHITGLAAQLVTFIRLAGTCFLMERMDSARMLRQLADDAITHTIAVPTVYIMLMQQPNYRAISLSSLRVAAYGGAPMPLDVVQRLREWLPHTSLFNVYGLTETTSPMTTLPPQDIEAKPLSVGLPIPVGQCRVVDPDTGREVEPGAVGELQVRGPQVIRYYWGKAGPAADGEGWVATGDLAWADEDGYIYVADRLKDMINRGGEKVYSIEVENVLVAHPDVVEAAVFGVPDIVYGEQVAAAVVLRPGATVTSEDMRVWAAGRLAKYKTPTFVVFLDQLPKNANGKVMKTVLRRRLVEVMGTVSKGAGADGGANSGNGTAAS